MARHARGDGEPLSLGNFPPGAAHAATQRTPKEAAKRGRDTRTAVAPPPTDSSPTGEGSYCPARGIDPGGATPPGGAHHNQTARNGSDAYYHSRRAGRGARRRQW